MHATYHPAPPASFSMMGIAVSPLVSGPETAGAWEAIHQRVEPGGGSPLHTLGADKLFVVLDGELVLIIDGEEHPSRAGATATVPAGVPHRFQNRSNEPAELLVVTSGDDHVAFLRGLSEIVAGGAADPDRLRSHAASHHVRLMG